MNIPFIFTSGIIVIILLLIGLILTFREFKEMSQHPEDYIRDDKRVTIEKPNDS